MSLQSLLIRRGTILKWASTDTDSFGNPPGNYDTEIDDVPYRRLGGQGGEKRTPSKEAPVIKHERFMFMPDASIVEKDRFVAGGQTYEFLDVQLIDAGVPAHHIEADMMRVNQ